MGFKKFTGKSLFLVIITAINVLVATGYSIVGIVKPELMLPKNIILTNASFIFALYAFARTIPLAVITIFSIIKQKISYIFILGFLAGCIQCIDGFIGIYQKDIGKSGGPFVISFLQFFALYKYNTFKTINN
ncbi:hypothetical protein PilKf_01267 [Pillotina sp. SPG140]|jgi:hypothetical protein